MCQMTGQRANARKKRLKQKVNSRQTYRKIQEIFLEEDTDI
jgi:hypothetical protein